MARFNFLLRRLITPPVTHDGGEVYSSCVSFLAADGRMSCDVLSPVAPKLSPRISASDHAQSPKRPARLGRKTLPPTSLTSEDAASDTRMPIHPLLALFRINPGLTRHPRSLPRSQLYASRAASPREVFTAPMSCVSHTSQGPEQGSDKTARLLWLKFHSSPCRAALDLNNQSQVQPYRPHRLSSTVPFTSFAAARSAPGTVPLYLSSSDHLLYTIAFRQCGRVRVNSTARLQAYGQLALDQ
ncbi:hypothetical protein OH76DRAFT_1038631 [Lentinus brumalis]|uniref:Uncharacterized protein n=1 Tax=Lentinus brumalis TaxID=2498619 RepID=A0A371CX88_9APHY|nr:hypothetical protein OH76DRAFT_1038631 [Polyporus brumalis]